MKPIILIDLENVKTADFGKFPAQAAVYIFVGEGQNKIDFNMVEKAQTLGEKPTWVKIKGNGKNAADFHIAYFLGRLSLQNPEGRFFILSKDKGFDPLVQHLLGEKIQCKRIESENEFAGGKAKGPKAPPAKLAARLEKMEPVRRPKTKKAMLGFIKNSDKAMADAAALEAMGYLAKSMPFTETNGKIVYPDKK